MDAAYQAVMNMVTTVPHPPTRRSSRGVLLLSESSPESSDSKPGASAAGLGHCYTGQSKDLGSDPLVWQIQRMHFWKEIEDLEKT